MRGDHDGSAVWPTPWGDGVYVNKGGWGIIEAGMSKIPDEQIYPETILVSGTYDCR